MYYNLIAEGMDPRAEKKMFRKMGMDNAVENAYNEGSYAAEGSNRTNHYPPGLRHDAFVYGFETSDPMGDHHGANA